MHICKATNLCQPELPFPPVIAQRLEIPQLVPPLSGIPHTASIDPVAPTHSAAHTWGFLQPPT